MLVTATGERPAEPGTALGVGKLPEGRWEYTVPRVQTANNFGPLRPLHEKLVDHMNAKDAEGWELVNGSEHNATLDTLHYQWTTLFWWRPRTQERRTRPGAGAAAQRWSAQRMA